MSRFGRECSRPNQSVVSLTRCRQLGRRSGRLGIAVRHSYLAEDKRLTIIQRLEVLRHHVGVFNRERKRLLEEPDHPEGTERIDDVARQDWLIIFQFLQASIRRILKYKRANLLLHIAAAIVGIIRCHFRILSGATDLVEQILSAFATASCTANEFITRHLRWEPVNPPPGRET